MAIGREARPPTSTPGLALHGSMLPVEDGDRRAIKPGCASCDADVLRRQASSGGRAAIAYLIQGTIGPDGTQDRRQGPRSNVNRCHLHGPCVFLAPQARDVRVLHSSGEDLESDRVCDVIDGPDGPFPGVCVPQQGPGLWFGWGGWMDGIGVSCGLLAPSSVYEKELFFLLFSFLGLARMYSVLGTGGCSPRRFHSDARMLLRYDKGKSMLMQGSGFSTPERDGDVNGQADPQSCRAVSDVLWCGSGEVGCGCGRVGVEGKRDPPDVLGWRMAGLTLMLT